MNIKNENIKCNLESWEDNNLNIIAHLSYSDANKSKDLICTQNNKKSGIYCWKNRITGKFYIGSVVNLTKRLRSYYSFNFLKRELLRHKSYIYSAILKYSHSNFNLYILEYCDQNIILVREQYNIDSLNPEYNILKITSSCLGRKHSEETKAKLSKSAKLRKRKEIFFSPEHTEFITKLNKGKKFSLETRKKMSQSALLRKKVNYSPEALLNMKRRSKAIILYNLNSTIFGSYPSIIEAAKDINCNPITINRALKTEKKLLKRRFIVKYKD